MVSASSEDGTLRVLPTDLEDEIAPSFIARTSSARSSSLGKRALMALTEVAVLVWLLVLDFILVPQLSDLVRVVLFTEWRDLLLLVLLATEASSFGLESIGTASATIFVGLSTLDEWLNRKNE